MTVKPAQERMLPLYEAKMIHHYDHRWGTYGLDGSTASVTDHEKADPEHLVLSRYWVSEAEVNARLSGRWEREWLLGWRDICRSTDERTMLATADGRGASPEGGTLLALPELQSAVQACQLLSCFNSLVFDFVARQKVGGSHLKYFTVRQLPVLLPSAYEVPVPWAPLLKLAAWIVDRVLELTYTAWDMQPFACDVGDGGPPFVWDPERRALLRAELDAAYFHLYGLERAEVDHVLDTFPIVKRKDEARFGEFRTQRLILECYDSMSSAVATGTPYTTLLDPPAGDGARNGNRDGI